MQIPCVLSCKSPVDTALSFTDPHEYLHSLKGSQTNYYKTPESAYIEGLPLEICQSHVVIILTNMTLHVHALSPTLPGYCWFECRWCVRWVFRSVSTETSKSAYSEETTYERGFMLLNPCVEFYIPLSYLSYSYGMPAAAAALILL